MANCQTINLNVFIDLQPYTQIGTLAKIVKVLQTRINIRTNILRYTTYLHLFWMYGTLRIFFSIPITWAKKISNVLRFQLLMKCLKKIELKCFVLTLIFNNLPYLTKYSYYNTTLSNNGYRYWTIRFNVFTTSQRCPLYGNIFK